MLYLKYCITLVQHIRTKGTGIVSPLWLADGPPCPLSYALVLGHFGWICYINPELGFEVSFLWFCCCALKILFSLAAPKPGFKKPPQWIRSRAHSPLFIRPNSTFRKRPCPCQWAMLLVPHVSFFYETIKAGFYMKLVRNGFCFNSVWGLSLNLSRSRARWMEVHTKPMALGFKRISQPVWPMKMNLWWKHIWCTCKDMFAQQMNPVTELNLPLRTIHVCGPWKPKTDLNLSEALNSDREKNPSLCLM